MQSERNPVKITGSGRLVSLDMMRGLIVAAMIVVNFSLVEDGYRSFHVYPWLLHAEWAGFTFADLVFPAFLFMVGVSISLTARSGSGLDAPALRKITMRSLRLFALGFLLSNFMYQWRHDWSFDGGFGVMGVLQRIALCYAAAAILHRSLSPRALIWTSGAILALYWPLTLLPIPDGQATNLAAPGMNFVSWFDRAVLGSHVLVPGPLGYDSEGILSTLPAIAQCLLGIIAGRWFVDQPRKLKDLGRFAVAGAVVALVGALWGNYFPIAKSLWTSSFVLLTTGLCMALLAGCQALLGAEAMPTPVARFFAAFGVNAILAYVIHFVLLTVAALPLVPDVYRSLSQRLSPAFSSLCVAAAFMLLIWIPPAILQRYHRSIRI